jgi:serine/threonine-protein kinase HipA
VTRYELEVWLHGTRVGLLREARTRKLELHYTDEALERWAFGDAVVSVALPLTPARRHPPAKVAAFLEGLLPEGEARTTLEDRYHVVRGDTLGLLRAIGRECAGAVVIQPFGDPPPSRSHPVPSPISETEVVKGLRDLASRPLGDDDVVRLSLAGQHDKLLLTKTDDGAWARPIGAIPSTHILKPEAPGLPGFVNNELLCLRLARLLELTTVEAELLDADGEPVLVVSRYDRVAAPDGQISRLHQEDLCQATSTPTSAKYQADGGPSLAGVAAILDRWAGSVEQLDQLVRVMTFNVVVGNADAHAKNISLLHHHPRGVELAPLYDVASTICSPTIVDRAGNVRNVSTDLAMTVNGVIDINTVTRDDLVAEASRWNYAASRARDVVDALLARFPRALADAADRTPGVANPQIELIAERIVALGRGAHAGA